eukprot:SAG31_NODE_25463_length_461_cov_0.613260_1_plen_46_part_01
MHIGPISLRFGTCGADSAKGSKKKVRHDRVNKCVREKTACVYYSFY